MGTSRENPPSTASLTVKAIRVLDETLDSAIELMVRPVLDMEAVLKREAQFRLADEPTPPSSGSSSPR